MATVYALAYVRVSTQEQADADLSIPAQQKAIRRFAESRGITILKEYVDEGFSAYHDGKRPAFQDMIRSALTTPGIKHILVHEPSRFSRDKYQTNAIKGDLRKRGISDVPVSSPYDPFTLPGLWQESIQDTHAMATSMTIAEHTVKGMAENAVRRDPETGYTYKNGGRVPYGYRVVKKNLGKNSRGKDMSKTLWEIDPVTGPILRKIVVEWRIGEGLAYEAIRNRLNEQGIPGPSGGPWGTSTIVEMLRDNRLETYAGTYYWNKEDRQTPGTRFKDRSEWTASESAHPAHLTKEEVISALALTASRQPRTTASRTSGSPWLLTGVNFENQPFFTCKSCGGNVVGSRPSSRHQRKYVCATHHNKGKYGCNNAFGVSKEWLEGELLTQISSLFGSDQAIEQFVFDVNERLSVNRREYDYQANVLSADLQKVQVDIDSVFEAFAKGLDPDLCNERLAALKARRSKVQEQIAHHQSNAPAPMTIDAAKAKTFVMNLLSSFETASNEQKRLLYRTYIRRLVLDPENEQVEVTFFPDALIETINRGSSPRCISNGVGSGT